MILRLLALALVLLAAPARAQERPTSYAEFDTSVSAGNGTELKAAIESGTIDYIYIQPGNYTLSNPVTINRSTSLFLHGVDRVSTRLIAATPTQPMFIVTAAPLIQLASVSLEPTFSASSTIDSKAIQFSQAQSLAFEMLDTQLGAAMLDIAGPGTYHMQAPVVRTNGKVQTAFRLNHPSADLFIRGGDITSNGFTLAASDYAHIWQLEGRLRVYSTTVQGALGDSDIQIETASELGPHMIANVRSEGVASHLAGTGAVSRILYVPPTTESVDVVMKNNGGAWDTGPTGGTHLDRMNCKIANYNARGTLWMIGNHADAYCGRAVVEGQAPFSTIVAIGNLISSPEPLPVTASRVIQSSELFAFNYWSNGDQTLPNVRWTPDAVPTHKLGAYCAPPTIPDDNLPTYLTRPPMPSAMPGLVDVKVTHGAVGDGVTDDLAALQAAFNASCTGTAPKLLYFPAGTYRITDTLYHNHTTGGTCHNGMPNGGFIGGAGSATTKIKMATGTKKGILASDGIAAATIQGITFESWTWAPADPELSTVDFDRNLTFSIATQLNNFYDVVIDGGWSGFATGTRISNGNQCSSQVLFGGQIKNANIGLNSGNSNALWNGVIGTTLTDNYYAFGSVAVAGGPVAGGKWFAYDTTSRGTKTREFLHANASNGGAWYFNDLDSNAPQFFVQGSTGGAYPLFFERSLIDPVAGQTYLFDVGNSMGPIFLRTRAIRSGVRVGNGTQGQSYALKLHSEIDDWSSAVAPAPNGQLDQLP